MNRKLSVLSWILASLLVIGTVLASADNPNGKQNAPGQDDERQMWLDEAQFWQTLYHRCVYRCEHGFGGYSFKIQQCNDYQTDAQARKECKERALAEFFECHKECTVFRDEADRSREKAKQVQQNNVPNKKD